MPLGSAPSAPMKTLLLTAATLVLLPTATFAANMLVNAGFEDPVTTDGAPFVGFWESFNGTGATAVNSTILPRTGAQSLQVSITDTINTFAGTFQDVPSLLSGTQYVFSGWHTTTSNPLNIGVEFRIEWRNSVSNTEIGRTPNSTTSPLLTYSPFSLTATAPAGADTARVVYAIQSFSTAPLGNGVVYVDDVSFDVIPEPTAMAMLGLGGLIMAARRRPRS
jgi:hypothetical protein